MPDHWEIGMGARRESHFDDTKATLAACGANQKEGGRWLYWFITRTVFVKFVSRISVDSVARAMAGVFYEYTLASRHAAAVLG